MGSAPDLALLPGESAAQALRAQLVEKQKSEARLEELLGMLSTTIESTADGILAFDSHSRALRFNQRFVDLFAIPDEMLAFWSHDSLLAATARSIAEPERFHALLDLALKNPAQSLREVIECRDGRIIECCALAQAPGLGCVGRVLSFRDLTERMRAEIALKQEKEAQATLIKKLEDAHNQLLQSEKMASIGSLAAGVAHEINNPIGFVNSNLGTLRGYIAEFLGLIDAYESCESSLPETKRSRIDTLKSEIDLAYLRKDVQSLLDESVEGIRRVKQIVQDLKDFSHVGTAKWQFADLHRGIESTFNIVNNEVKYKADVVRDFGELPEVECLPSQLNQVFMNLLVNAAQAMPDGRRGTITVRTRAEPDAVHLQFADDGCGIPSDSLKRIFDPFFTTKPVGKGTGLGLSLSYGIVERHHGSIWAESELGHGTLFHVRLPLRQPTQPPA